MQEFNFLNSNLEEKYILFSQWVKTSSLFISLTFIILLTFQLQKKYRLNLKRSELSLMNQKLTNFDDFLKAKINRNQEKEAKKKQFEIIQKIASQANRVLVFQLLTEMINIIDSDIFLNSFEFSKKNAISLTGFSNSAQAINGFAQRINNLDFVTTVNLSNIKVIDDQINDSQDSFLYEFLINIKIKKF